MDLYFQPALKLFYLINPHLRKPLPQQGRIDYSKPLFYKDKIYSYSTSTNEIPEPGLLENFTYQVFPNPTKDEIKVIINSGYDIKENNTRYEISNLSGQILIANTLSSMNNSIDLSNLVPGVYIIKIFEGANVHSQKLIKR
jgi:hypothetical protein